MTARPVDSRLLSGWLWDIHVTLPPASDGCWDLTKNHVLESMRRAHATSPGRDGFPYKACHKLGKYAAEFLLDAAEDLQEPSGCPSELTSFNHALLCCHPKSSKTHDIVHGDFYGANGTRPLAIVNTDNRLLANAYRLMPEPTLNTWGSEMQRGFRQGRSTLSKSLMLIFAQ